MISFIAYLNFTSILCSLSTQVMTVNYYLLIYLFTEVMGRLDQLTMHRPTTTTSFCLCSTSPLGRAVNSQSRNLHKIISPICAQNV